MGRASLCDARARASAPLAVTTNKAPFAHLRWGGTLPYSANEITLSQNKKTIQPDDVLKALDEIEFGFMKEQLAAEAESA